MSTTFLVTEVEHYIELVFCLFSFWLLFEMYVFKYFKIPLIITSGKKKEKKKTTDLLLPHFVLDLQSFFSPQVPVSSISEFREGEKQYGIENTGCFFIWSAAIQRTDGRAPHLLYFSSEIVPETVALLTEVDAKQNTFPAIDSEFNGRYSQ